MIIAAYNHFRCPRYRCRNCGELGHNARRCQKVTEKSPVCAACGDAGAKQKLRENQTLGRFKPGTTLCDECYLELALDWVFPPKDSQYLVRIYESDGFSLVDTD